MGGHTRVTAVSAMAASLGLTGAVLLAAAPLASSRADAAQVGRVDPTRVEPNDPSLTEEPLEPAPEPTVTVTITESPEPTVTQTRTVTPKPSKKPKPAKTPSSKPAPGATKTSPVVPPPETPVAPVIPTGSPLVPATETPQSTVSDPQVSLALVTPTPSASETTNSSFEDPTPDSVPIEIRNASPEYDQLTLSRKLAVPGVLLAVLVMLGVLIFEGRVRRVAHAAAVRKAGPRAPGRHRGGEPFAGGYPMPGYPIYQEGTAYAPIISFVPVQRPSNAPLPSPYQDPQGYGAPHEQGFGFPAHQGRMTVPGPGTVGSSEPWPRADDPDPGSGGGPSGDTMTLPVPEGGTPPEAGSGPEPPASGQGSEAGERTLQAPLPEGEPRRGLLGRFRRGAS